MTTPPTPPPSSASILTVAGKGASREAVLSTALAHYGLSVHDDPKRIDAVLLPLVQAPSADRQWWIQLRMSHVDILYERVRDDPLPGFRATDTRSQVAHLLSIAPESLSRLLKKHGRVPMKER